MRKNQLGQRVGRKLNGEEISRSLTKTSGDGDKSWSSGSLSRSERWSGNMGNIFGEKAKGQMKNKTRKKKNRQRRRGRDDKKGKNE